ncbi:hypothetical protein TWF730_001240 [Orbilia blumenaviensis]|uniref:Uncharacterized protein n=1 Tax=Orbilia blumenaviensis TaxID=1796055 RepID=A0AAV9VR67_9PEZI
MVLGAGSVGLFEAEGIFDISGYGDGVDGDDRGGDGDDSGGDGVVLGRKRGGGWCLITAFGGVFVGGTTSPAFRYLRSLVLPTPSTAAAAATPSSPRPHHDRPR